MLLLYKLFAMPNAGSVNDSRIFRNSDLWMSIQENRTKFFSGNELLLVIKHIQCCLGASHPI